MPEDPQEFVSRDLCDERTKRVEQKIDSMKNEILLAIKDEHSMSWKAKAAIISSVIMATSSIIVAVIYSL